jgi:hypothetical protein
VSLADKLSVNEDIDQCLRVLDFRLDWLQEFVAKNNRYASLWGNFRNCFLVSFWEEFL